MRRREVVVMISGLAYLAVAGEGRAQSSFDDNYRSALVQLQSGQTGMAIDSMNRALASLGGQPAPDPTIYNNLGWALMRAGRFDEAQRAFESADSQRGRLSAQEQQKLQNNMNQLARLRHP
jgi:Flp pilus assembly protein TadD